MNVQFYIPEDLLTLIIKIPLIIGGFYLFCKCVGWKFSWTGAAGALSVTIAREFTDNIWQAIGVIVGILLVVSFVEFMLDGKKLEQRLINMLMGDKEAAERLIRYEEARNPDALRSECVAAAIERLQQDRRSWNPGEPVKHWRNEPEPETHWGWGIAGWIIGIAAICLVGGKIWQQRQEATQARMVQPTHQMSPPQFQTPMPEVVIPTPQPRQVDLPRTRSKPAAPSPDQTILCWIDGNGKRIYSNTVPQGKGVKTCP